MNPATTTQEVQAKISPRILQYAHLLFNQSNQTLLTELLQNSRRAGATQVEVNLQKLDETHTEVCILDNGCGIENPQALLTLGDSGWDKTVQSNENPAGMGFFSLCHLDSGVRIRSNTWKLHITKDTFQGNTILPVKTAPQLTGTEIRFTLPAEMRFVKATFENCIKYYPVPTKINGQPAAQESFLKDAESIFEVPGARIAVYSSSRTGINFYGLTLDTHSNDKKLVPESLGFNTRVDVLDNTLLDLVLPSRNTLVENQKLQRLKAECRKAIYRHIAQTKCPHKLPYALYKEAQDLNISIPEATPDLNITPQRSCQSNYDVTPFPEWLSQNRNHFHVDPTKESVAISASNEAEVLAYYLAAQGGNPKKLPIPVEANPSMEGYSWYPRSAVEYVEFVAKLGRKEIRWCPAGQEIPEGFDAFNLKGRPTSAKILIKFTDQDKPVEVPTNIVFADGNYTEEGVDSQWAPTKNVKSEAEYPFCLTALLQALYFSESDDFAADSFDTQQSDWKKETEKSLTLIFGSQEELNIRIVKTALENWEVSQALRELDPKEIRITFGENGKIEIRKKSSPRKG